MSDVILMGKEVRGLHSVHLLFAGVSSGCLVMCRTVSVLYSKLVRVKVGKKDCSDFVFVQMFPVLKQEKTKEFGGGSYDFQRSGSFKTFSLNDI